MNYPGEIINKGHIKRFFSWVGGGGEGQGVLWEMCKWRIEN